MDAVVRSFLRSAVVWLVGGMSLGIWMAIDPPRVFALRPAHMHALLPGFVLMMIFGVGYHILPRFSGRAVPWARGPLAHLILANAGLSLMVTGFLLRPWWSAGALLLALGGTGVLAGAAIFAHAVWRLTEPPKWTLPTRKEP